MCLFSSFTLLHLRILCSSTIHNTFWASVYLNISPSKLSIPAAGTRATHHEGINDSKRSYFDLKVIHSKAVSENNTPLSQTPFTSPRGKRSHFMADPLMRHEGAACLIEGLHTAPWGLWCYRGAPRALTHSAFSSLGLRQISKRGWGGCMRQFFTRRTGRQGLAPVCVPLPTGASFVWERGRWLKLSLMYSLF